MSSAFQPDFIRGGPESRFDNVCGLRYALPTQPPTQLFTAYLEHVDTQALSKRSIKLGYTPEVLTAAGEFLSSTLYRYHNALHLSRGHCDNVGIDGFPECGSSNLCGI